MSFFSAAEQPAQSGLRIKWGKRYLIGRLHAHRVVAVWWRLVRAVFPGNSFLSTLINYYCSSALNFSA